MFALPVRTAAVRWVVGIQIVALTFLIGAVADWSHDHLAAAAVALGVGAFSYRLIRLAYARHLAGEPWRSTGLMGLGMAATALTGAVLTVGTGLDASDAALAKVSVAGLGVAVAAFLPALLLAAGGGRGLTSRARQALDGLGVGLLLLYSVWVLVICPNGRLDSLPVWIAILSCCTLSMAAVTALRGGRAGPAVLAFAGAVALVVVGLIAFAVCLAWNHLVGYPPLAGGALVGAAALAWWGARHRSATERVEVAEPGPVLAGLPVLAAPAAVAVAVTLHRLIVGTSFGPVAATLGILSVTMVVLRESLTARDVARYARRVSEQEACFRSLVAGSNDVIMVLDRDLVVRWQSAAAERLFALAEPEVVGRHFQSMLHPEDAIAAGDRLAGLRSAEPDRRGAEPDRRGAGADRRGVGERARRSGEGGQRPVLIEARLRDGHGRWRDTESSATNQLEVPAVRGIVVHIRDISERTEMRQRLQVLGSVDQLTGLPNRAEVMRTIAELRRGSRVRGCLLLVKLDGFTAVNDVRGYDVGDEVLVQAAKRLRSAAAETDVPARLSGDEFAVVTKAGPVQAYALAASLVTVLADPIVLPSGPVHVSASIGMADLAGDEDVLRRADLALRRARQVGRGRVEWYDASVEQVVLRRMRLEQDLPEALRRGELDVVYQPILELAGRRPVAVEALLRWRHPDLGILMPAEVIPVAEDLGLIDEIGGWVLYQAGKQLAAWLQDGRDTSMAVNVSARRLDRPRLFEDVSRVIAEHRLPAENLILEIGEAGIGSATAVSEELTRVRSLGVRTVLDEFGSGTESLTHLRALPLDLVKIGRAFFDDTAGRPEASVPILATMVGLARRLGLEVVALGLETPAHLEVVRAAGCQYGQGHIFARPQPAERVEAYLEELRSRESASHLP